MTMDNSLHPEQVRWIERYRRTGFRAFGMEPTVWLRRHEELLRRLVPGPILDVAAGNGRNAFYVAHLGFEVDALDISDLAVHWIGQQARSRQLRVNPHWANLASENLPSDQYRVVVNTNYLERRLFPGIKSTLLPGGLLLFETMTWDQVDRLGGSMDRRFLLAPNELRNAFWDLQILAYREGVFVCQSTGNPRAVASLVAGKTADKPGDNNDEA